jgi:methyltransferase
MWDELPSPMVLTWFVLVGSFLLTRTAERRLHGINTNFLKLAGGEELLAGLSVWFHRLPIVAVLAAALEYRFLGGEIPRELMFGAFSMVVGAWLLRMWAMNALGWLWTLGVRSLPPGAHRVTKGPYRFFAHPDTLSRAVDGVGLCLFLGSWRSAAVYLAVFLPMAVRLELVEARLLRDRAAGMSQKQVIG